MRNIIIFLIVIGTNVGAQLSLRKGMMNISLDTISIDKFLEIINSKYIWSGFLMYAISFSVYLYILSKFEASQVFPIIMSTGFLLLLTFSVMFLGETLTFSKIVGILLIIIGISLVSFSNKIDV